ncbi:MAG: hypothetical protein WAK60_08790 [Sedimentisphaerales bacterium]
MVVELPKFENKYGLILTVCGEIKNLTAKIPEKNPKTPPVAKYDTSAGTAFVRAWIKGKKETYLHVDCALSKFFPKGKEPQVTCKEDKIFETIDSVSGVEIDCHVEACFDIPFSDLPEKGTIRSLYAEQKSADISMQLTGAEVSFTGAPLQQIKWNIHKEKEPIIVHVWMKGERVATVSDRYIIESWDWMNEQLSIFVLGRR